jgi:hypothetical protein
VGSIPLEGLSTTLLKRHAARERKKKKVAGRVIDGLI